LELSENSPSFPPENDELLFELKIVADSVSVKDEKIMPVSIITANSSIRFSRLPLILSGVE
jgi:hypothetical protein